MYWLNSLLASCYSNRELPPPPTMGRSMRQEVSVLREGGRENKADFTKKGHEKGHAATAVDGSGGRAVLLHRSEDHQPFVIGESERRGGRGMSE